MGMFIFSFSSTVNDACLFGVSLNCAVHLLYDAQSLVTTYTRNAIIRGANSLSRPLRSNSHAPLVFYTSPRSHSRCSVEPLAGVGLWGRPRVIGGRPLQVLLMGRVLHWIELNEYSSRSVVTRFVEGLSSSYAKHKLWCASDASFYK